jgi:hypothetical protein
MFITKDEARFVFGRLLGNVCRHYQCKPVSILAFRTYEYKFFNIKKMILVYLCLLHKMRPLDIIEFFDDYGFEYKMEAYKQHIARFKESYEKRPRLRLVIEKLKEIPKHNPKADTNTSFIW